jgi:uncharacterized protein YjlB
MHHLLNPSASFSHHILPPARLIPNNLTLPVIYYKNVLQLPAGDTNPAKKLLESNGWQNSWVGGIYTYHHYHSTAHEVLVILQGDCMIEVGGEDGEILKVKQGDVLVLPAGVAHKNLGASKDFLCMGAYPDGQDFDMNYCRQEEMETAQRNISSLALPKNDPLFGSKGPLVTLWKSETSEPVITEELQF